MSRVLAVFGLLLLLSLVYAAPAFAQPQPQIVITAPTNGGRVPGPDVTVTIQVTGTTLVPAANATKLEDMHVHYMLDVDPAPWLSGATPIPAGQPEHRPFGSADQHVRRRSAGPAPRRGRARVIESRRGAAPVAPSVSFTVGAGVAAPAQLPRTGDASDPTTLLFGTGVVGVALGIALRALARRRLRLGHGR